MLMMCSLKGMLYGDIVRSPYAHALIKNVDISKAMEVPGVVAVITGKDLAAAGLAWMPTLSADTRQYWHWKKFISRCRKLPSSSPPVAMPPPMGLPPSRLTMSRCQ